MLCSAPAAAWFAGRTEAPPRLARTVPCDKYRAVDDPVSPILALDASLGQCSAALVASGAVLAERVRRGGRGQVQSLAPMLREVLDAAGVGPSALGAVAVTLGPGSFTGLRAALALAHGFALAAGVGLVGVTVPEALAAALGPKADGRAIWAAIDSRRGRVFLDRGGGPQAVALDALPRPEGPVAITGDAAPAVAARLAATGADVLLTDARQPQARFVARAAMLRRASGLPPLAPLPIYVDAAEAKLPGRGLRPAPAA